MESNLVIIIVILILILLLTYYFNNKFGMNKNSKETFITTQDQTLTNISNFLQNAGSNISSQSSANLTPDQLKSNQDLIDQLNSLNSSIKFLIDKQNDVLPVSQPDNLNQLDDLQATQKVQDAYILQLQSRLDNLQKIYASYLQKKTQQIGTVKYDKIPVYSSCIVAEANGQYTA